MRTNRFIDGGIAALTLAVLAFLIPVAPGGPGSAAGLGVAIGLAVVQAGSVLWIRRHPVPAMIVATGAGIGLEILCPQVAWLGLVGVPLTYLARLRPPRVSLWALGALLLPTPWKLLTGGWRDMLLAMVGICLAWSVGELQRGYAARRAGERHRIVAEERARIARELHDVVAHNVSVIVVQAAAAGDVFDARPDRARAALAAIEGTARSALVELRTLLHTLRPEEPAGHDPQPGLEQLETLVGSVREAGLRVVVRREGAGPPLPGGVDLSAYRIVQESLTNTLRHGRASRADVTVRYAEEAVDLEITDDGTGGPAGPASGGSGKHGIVGMRERARLHGGTLDAGPRPEGGFRVRARLPLEPAR